MKYIPKSNIIISDSKQGEFVRKGTNEPYMGKYIETSTGKFYAGKDPLKLNEELIKSSEINQRVGGNKRTNPFNPNFTNKVSFGNSFTFNRYKIINNKIYKKLENKKTIINTKPSPSSKDYTRGHFMRYFAQRVNDPLNYIEIDFDTYKKLNNEDFDFDYALYNTGAIKWALKGNTRRQNTIQILKVSKNDNFPKLEILFPKLNEYEKDEFLRYNSFFIF